jgi:arylsulfatase
MPAHIIDMAPTLLELAGGQPSDLNDRYEAPGISLVPYLREDLLTERPPLFFHHERKNAIRDGDWKAVTIDSGGPWELYDLSFDRGETMDLSSVETKKLEKLVSQWEDQRSTIESQIRNAENRADK